jgi:hypothetical protein
MKKKNLLMIRIVLIKEVVKIRKILKLSFSLLPNVLIITDVRFFGTGEFPFTAVAECSPLER